MATVYANCTDTKMAFVIRHVRFIQQLEEAGVIQTFQIDGRLNPSDAFTKWLDSVQRRMHYSFMMGYPLRAKAIWEKSRWSQNYKPKRIVPVPTAVMEDDHPEHVTKMMLKEKLDGVELKPRKVRFAAKGDDKAGSSQGGL